MSQAEAGAWWAEVQHLREAAERRQRYEVPRLRAVPAALPETVRAMPTAAPPEREPAPMPSRRRAPRSPAPGRATGADRRRTVEITGRTVPAPAVPRLVEVERRRPPRSTMERVGPRPDRIAMWAPMLGFLLILVAILSSH